VPGEKKKGLTLTKKKGKQAGLGCSWRQTKGTCSMNRGQKNVHGGRGGRKHREAKKTDGVFPPCGKIP